MPPTQTAQTVTPNLYHVSGHHHDAYQDSHPSKSFRGDKIRAVECDLGTLVSVTLRSTPDVGSTSLSLFVPRTRIKHKITLAVEGALYEKLIALEGLGPFEEPHSMAECAWPGKQLSKHRSPSSVSSAERPVALRAGSARAQHGCAAGAHEAP
jgi:hypothetical protein